MIMYMCKKICITNRNLADGDFINQIEKVCQTDCDKILLREKDLDDDSYSEIAEKVKRLCDRYDKELIIHHRIEVCKNLGIKQIHFPMPYLTSHKSPEAFIKELKKSTDIISVSVSVHSVEEAVFAEVVGVDELIAGHIFDTDCKKGIPGRGLDFLKAVCESVKIPVYAIGGMSEDKEDIVCQAGAAGFCMMSSYMKLEK